MELNILHTENATVEYNFLYDQNNRWVHVIYTITPTGPAPISEQIKQIENSESFFFKHHLIDQQSPVIKRLFSSDLISHKAELKKYRNRQPTDFCMSITEQPPAIGVKIVMMGMCLNEVVQKHRDGNILRIETENGIQHLFFENLDSPEKDRGAEEQTFAIFETLRDSLHKYNANIQDNLIRTWIYAPHIDADYAGIVKARKSHFDKLNLTPKTHYIASTGIQGGSNKQYSRVFMDAYASIGVSSDKIRYIQAPEYLCPTHHYGVTFERATAIQWGMIDFLFISGTASIDNLGNTLHTGDVVLQTTRTLKNITALLDAAHFSKKNLSSLIVYLRDTTDYQFVKPIIDNFSGYVPAVYVKGAVCRPQWLIEIEATAAKQLS